MTARVCFLGYEHLGSWKIRGEQIAAQRSKWVAAGEITDNLLGEFEIFCVVKYFKPGWEELLKKHKKIVVIDVVDGWRQPADHATVKNPENAQQLFKKRWRKWRFADAFIFPTMAMKEDLHRLVPLSSVIYHHFRPGMDINPIRPNVQSIGYEGSPEFLGNWCTVLDNYCKAHNIDFIINPTSLSSIDIGVAVRGNEHDSYLTRRYKSNVKLANFYGSGTPCAVQNGQSAYHETDCDSVPFFRDKTELIAVLDLLRQDYTARKRLHEEFILASSEYGVRRIADQYEQFFKTVKRYAGTIGRRRDNMRTNTLKIFDTLRSRLWARST